MNKTGRFLVAALALAAAHLAAAPASAAMVPAGVGTVTAAAATLPATEVRYGGRGGFRGGHARGFRGGYRGPRGWGYGRRGIRPGWGWGVAPVVGMGYYSCIRKGWVWNGYRYVWRRYRVC